MSDEVEPGTHGHSLPGPLVSRAEWIAEVQRLLLVHQRRSGKSLKKTTLAKRIGVSKSSLYAYLNGTSLAPMDVLDRLLAELDVSPPDRQRLATARDSLEIRNNTGAGPGPPSQIPRALRYFVGRADELDVLTAQLDHAAQGFGTVVISSIGGTAGVGKTALAIYWARQVLDRFPDGQLFVNLRGFDPGRAPMAPAEAVRGFLEALRLPVDKIPTDLDAQTALYRRHIEGKRMLVVLDNARDTEQVRPLLPTSPTCLVVITSRQKMMGLIARDQAEYIQLDRLSTADARHLLVKVLGEGRVRAEAAAADELIECCAHLPLALSIAAARAITNPDISLGALSSALGHERDRLAMLSTDDSKDTDIRTVFSWSYRALSPEAARMFRLLGVHPGPDIALPAAASLAGRPGRDTEPLLRELTAASLLDEQIPGRYEFHDLLRAYAAEQAHANDADAERHGATLRVLDHYLHAAHRAARLLDPNRDPITMAPSQPGVTPEEMVDHAQALAWLEAEHPVLLAVTARASDLGFDSHAWQIPWSLASFFDRRGHWHDYVATQLSALSAARRLADQRGQADAHRALGRAYTRLGSYREARTHLRHALDLYAQIDDRVGLAHTHGALAGANGREGRHDRALHHGQQALELYRAAAHQVGEADALNGVGWFHARLGNYHEALTHCQQALLLHRRLGNSIHEAETLDSLGFIQHQLGHHDQAIAGYTSALELVRTLGDRFYEAATLTHLGDTHHAAGDLEAARDHWQQALDILNDLQHSDADQVRTKLLGAPGS